MRRITLCLVMLGLIWAVSSFAETPAATDKPQNIILMGWDAAHRDHVKALLKDGKLPNLKKLVDEGAIVDVDVTSGATDTKAGWSQILTGYKPEVTGVYSNGRYRDVPAGCSVFERLKANFGADKFAAVAVIGKKGHCGEINEPFKRPYEAAKDAVPADNSQAKAGGKKGRKKDTAQPGFKGGSLGHVVEENGQKFLVFEGSPYFTMHKACDEWHFGLMEDVKVGDKAVEMLEKYKDKPFFFFVHCAEVDHSGHKHGEPSKEYNDAIISGDTQLGRVVEKLKTLNLYEKTKVYVTADHGFDVGGHGHGYAPYVFFAGNDKTVMRDGTRADITPTILARFGLDLSKFEPKLDGESLLVAATKPVEKAPAKKGEETGKKRAGKKTAAETK